MAADRKKKSGEKTRAKRPGKAELELRITEVTSLIALGRSRATILLHAQTKWNLERRAADNLIRKATQELGEKQEMSRKEQAGYLMSRLDRLYEDAAAEGDRHDCIFLIDRYLKVFQYAKEDVEDTGDDYTIIFGENERRML
ncbi:MAG TPA: hypothetical protein O0X27_05640 [Methanocorpusculum sp.]|nr:hypothetical protein [Methanocorpusculum sp.]